ncbi:MAG TPA: RHS repeat-associated core domain-containing protein [Candidatus Kapabacteria bacterium]|nr:RHS repeat-associated core domain-containing protein [Candidatus Kapabacteria bacterium]
MKNKQFAKYPLCNKFLCYIDKEKDRESKLGDHGVRKYDYEIGRFTSIDPLWEKYTGWTGYQYTRNNPINRIDYNGMNDGQFGSWMQVGPMQELILGDKNVNTYQEIIENSEKLANKQLINAWAEIGLMGLTGLATDVALSSPFAAKYLSIAGNYVKGLLGFGDDAVNLGFSINPSKFDYFFGRVVSGPEHNISRSAQNLKDLTTLGIKNEVQLTNIFKNALKDGSIISSKTSKYGTTVLKGIEIGNNGKLEVGFFYQGGNMNSTPSISTIIPKIYK